MNRRSSAILFEKYYRLAFEFAAFAAGRFVLTAGAAFEVLAGAVEFADTAFEFAASVLVLEFAAAAGLAPLNSFGLSTTFFASRLSIFASFIAIA